MSTITTREIVENFKKRIDFTVGQSPEERGVQVEARIGAVWEVPLYCFEGESDETREKEIEQIKDYLARFIVRDILEKMGVKDGDKIKFDVS